MTDRTDGDVERVRRAAQVAVADGAGLPDVIDAVRPAVVQIAVFQGGRTQRIGTGCWIDACGLVITALHVVRQAQHAGGADPTDATSLRVSVAPTPSERARGNFVHLPVDVVAVDAGRDLALLRTDPTPLRTGQYVIEGHVVATPARVMPLSASRARDGEPVAVSGYPVVEPVLVTTCGTVASGWAFDLQQLPEGAGPVLAQLDDLYLVDATIGPGNSGGPVYRTADGALIGVCLSIRMAQATVEQLDRELLYPSGLGVVVPAKYVRRLVEQHRQTSAAGPT